MDFKTLINEMLKEKLDDVNKDALKGDFKNRSDKDIDNDGEVDDQDEYLHNRRKAITKAVKKESIDEAMLDKKKIAKAVKARYDFKKGMDYKQIVPKINQELVSADMKIFVGDRDIINDILDLIEEVQLDEAMFTVDDIDGMAKEIKSGLKAPFVNVSKSTLGGAERVSVFIKVSLDKPEDWTNNIYQNSRHAMFRVGSDDGTLELSTKHYSLPKFRKAKFKNTKDIIAKINAWIDSASSVKESVELDEADGWIAMFNGKKLEITNSDAKDLYSAKMYAAKELKVPKSKMGLLAIAPAYNESKKENALFNSLKEIIKNGMLDK